MEVILQVNIFKVQCSWHKFVKLKNSLNRSSLNRDSTVFAYSAIYAANMTILKCKKNQQKKFVD